MPPLIHVPYTTDYIFVLHLTFAGFNKFILVFNFGVCDFLYCYEPEPSL